MSTFETPQLQAPSLGTPTRRRNDGKLYVELKTATPPAKTLDNMRVNLARGLKPLGPCKPHGEVVSIAAGRPSLADTFGEMQGHVAAGNGSLGYLIERGVTPHFCVVIDAMPHMAEIVVPDNGVYYLLSTSCDPGLFDKLLKADCKIRIWNPLPANVGVGIDETSFQMREGGKGFRLLGEDYPDQFMIGGGTSVGLRTIFLGYVLGYRTFHLHGNDASSAGLRRTPTGTDVGATGSSAPRSRSRLQDLAQLPPARHLVRQHPGPDAPAPL